MQTTEANTNLYMLIFRETSPDTYQVMSPDQRQQLLKKWNDWYDGLAAQGKATSGRPLKLEGRVVSGIGGERVIDGPFAEGKEAVGGFFLLRVDSMDEATEIAKQCPSLRYGLVVEVRPVAPSCPVLTPREQQSERVPVSV